MDKRLKKVLWLGAVLLLGGCTYAVFCRVTGWGIPCIFHLVTGLHCPGCGVSRMCLALLRLDIRGAWEANPAILALLPAGAVLAVRIILRYIRTGASRPTRGEEWIMIGMSVILVLYAVWRNIPVLLSLITNIG